jgi:hypothetical protein
MRSAADTLLASHTPLVSRGEVQPPPAPLRGRVPRRELSAAMAELVCPFTAWTNPWADPVSSSQAGAATASAAALIRARVASMPRRL